MRRPRLRWLTWLEWLAARVLPPASRDATLGDLRERYEARAGRSGLRRARRWYARQVAGFLVRVPLARAAGRLHHLGAGAGRRDPTTGAWPRVGLAADLRQAGRAVIRERGFSAVVLLVLGLAVGATATVFSVVNGILLRPLPFPDPGALVMLWDEYPPRAGAADPMPATRRHVDAWRARTDVFTSVGAFESMPATIDAGDWPDRVDAALVTADLLPALGAVPELGRAFTAADDVPGAPPVALLAHDLWRTRFGADPSIVGRVIRVDGEATEIVGVMPEDFWFYDPYAATRSYASRGASAAALWRPLAGRFPDELGYPRYRVVARLRPGVSIDAAAAAAGAADRALPADVDSADGRVRVVAMDEQVVGPVRSRLVGLQVAVGLVLLVACVNLVSLFAARLEARRTEFAVRAALGAGRGRLLRSLGVHAALLGLGGGMAGLLLARLALPRLLDLVPRGLPLAHRVSVDAGVAAVALGLSVAVALAVTILAGAPIGTSRLAGALAAGSRSMAGRAGSRRFRHGLIAAEVALSAMLLVSATILARNLAGLNAADTGFDARRVLTFQSLLMLTSPDAPPDFAFFDRLEARLRDVPGLEAVGSATILPFSRWGQTAAVRVGAEASRAGAGAGRVGAEAGRAGAEAEATLPRVDYRVVSPGYFDALRVARLAGRTFAETDTRGAPPVVIVNRMFADRYLGGAAAAIGRAVALSRGSTPPGTPDRRVVGVVADVREERLFGEARPAIYVPTLQTPMPMRQFVVRTTGAPAAMVESIRRATASVDPRQPLQSFVPLETLVAQSIEEERFVAATVGTFAIAAVVLALVGLYGVVAFATRQRDREVGVRLALGASRSGVFRLVVGDGMRPVVAGLALGCLGAAGTARWLSGLLHGVPAIDPLSYAAATLAFGVVSFAACLVPARRAAAIDPVRTLSEG